eukprot:scaffold15692_cov129-Skeletonema_dohrnii-CCMP3373.AAC.8
MIKIKLHYYYRTSCIILVYNIDHFILFSLLPIPPHKQSSDAELAKGYEYLLGLKLWTFTFERAEDIRRQKGDKEAEVVALESTSPESIWLSDLDELDTVLVKVKETSLSKQRTPSSWIDRLTLRVCKEHISGRVNLFVTQGSAV